MMSISSKTDYHHLMMDQRTEERVELGPSRLCANPYKKAFSIVIKDQRKRPITKQTLAYQLGKSHSHIYAALATQALGIAILLCGFSAMNEWKNHFNNNEVFNLWANFCIDIPKYLNITPIYEPCTKGSGYLHFECKLINKTALNTTGLALCEQQAQIMELFYNRSLCTTIDRYNVLWYPQVVPLLTTGVIVGTYLLCDGSRKNKKLESLCSKITYFVLGGATLALGIKASLDGYDISGPLTTAAGLILMAKPTLPKRVGWLFSSLIGSLASFCPRATFFVHRPKPPSRRSIIKLLFDNAMIDNCQVFPKEVRETVIKFLGCGYWT